MLSKIFYFILVLVVFDLVYLNYLFFSLPKPKSYDDSALVNKLSSLESQISNLSTISPTVPIPTIPLAPKAKSKHVSYLPINGNFSQLSYDWINVPTSQFYFDTADYVGLKDIRFEANFKLFNGNGLAFVRLFDSTHGTPLPGSQIQSSSQQDTIMTSSPVTFLSGRNLIKVQIKSLTADTTVFNSARLIITSEY